MGVDIYIRLLYSMFNCFRRGMDKENGEGGDAAGKPPPDGLLDAAGLFGGES